MAQLTIGLMTDAVMPEMNGWDHSRRLMESHSKLKLLFTSGYTADVIAPFSAACVTIIRYPFLFPLTEAI